MLNMWQGFFYVSTLDAYNESSSELTGLFEEPEDIFNDTNGNRDMYLYDLVRYNEDKFRLEAKKRFDTELLDIHEIIQFTTSGGGTKYSNDTKNKLILWYYRTNISLDQSLNNQISLPAMSIQTNKM